MDENVRGAMREVQFFSVLSGRAEAPNWKRHPMDGGRSGHRTEREPRNWRAVVKHVVRLHFLEPRLVVALDR